MVTQRDWTMKNGCIMGRGGYYGTIYKVVLAKLAELTVNNWTIGFLIYIYIYLLLQAISTRLVVDVTFVSDLLLLVYIYICIYFYPEIPKPIKLIVVWWTPISTIVARLMLSMSWCAKNVCMYVYIYIHTLKLWLLQCYKPTNTSGGSQKRWVSLTGATAATRDGHPGCSDFFFQPEIDIYFPWS